MEVEVEVEVEVGVVFFCHKELFYFVGGYLIRD